MWTIQAIANIAVQLNTIAAPLDTSNQHAGNDRRPPQHPFQRTIQWAHSFKPRICNDGIAEQGTLTFQIGSINEMVAQTTGRVSSLSADVVEDLFIQVRTQAENLYHGDNGHRSPEGINVPSKAASDSKSQRKKQIVRALALMPVALELCGRSRRSRTSQCNLTQSLLRLIPLTSMPPLVPAHPIVMKLETK